MKRIIILQIIMFSLSCNLGAVCSEPRARVCTLFTRSDAVFVGKLISERYFLEDGREVDEKDCSDEWCEKLCWRFKVIEMFKGPKCDFIDIYSENASGRLWGEISHTYVIFSDMAKGKEWKNWEGKYFGGSCGYTVDIKREPSVIAEIKVVMKNVKLKKNADIRVVVIRWDEKKKEWIGAQGVKFNLIRRWKKWTATSDDKGEAHFSVKAGRYKLVPEVVNNLVLWEPSMDNPDEINVLPGGGGEVKYKIQ